MHTFTILLVSVWFHVAGHAAGSAFVVQTQDTEECKADSPEFLQVLKKKGFSIAGKSIPIEKISGTCLTIEEPLEA